jgi:arginine/ornithine N-succinyltransferase beta subunit
MAGARLSALETLARNRHDGSTPLPDDTIQLLAQLVVRICALEAIPRPEPASALILISSLRAAATRLARRMGAP